MPAPTDDQIFNPAVNTGETPSAGMMAALDSALADATETPGPDVTADPPSHGQDPSDAPPNLDPTGAPASTTPDPAAAAPDSAPATPEADKPTDPNVTDPAADPAPAARPSDEFGELPKDVKAETRERFESMRTKYDTTVAERDHAVHTAQEWNRIITDTGITPEKFGVVLQALKSANSGTAEGLQHYYDVLAGELAGTAKLLGREAPGVDPLADHADLQERVENETLDRSDALEIAQARASRNISTLSQQQTRQQTEQQAVIDSGLAEVSTLGNQLRTADPAGFAAKLPFVAPMIDSVIANLPPDRWVAAITKAYNDMPTPAAALPPTPRPPPMIRPGGNAGGGGSMDKKPGSALEAMDMALRRA